LNIITSNKWSELSQSPEIVPVSSQNSKATNDTTLTDINLVNTSSNEGTCY